MAMEDGGALLVSPPWKQMEEYYSQLTGAALRVKSTATMGKGLFAERDFDAEEVILIEEPLFAAQHSHNKNDAVVCGFCFRYVGSIQLQIQRKLEAPETQSCCYHEEEDEEEDHHRHGVSSEEALALLKGDGFSLPHGDKFLLPEVVKCSGGCSEIYCSKSCAQRAWHDHHSLLCDGVSQHRDELVLFKEFADETNDIFHLASKLIAKVMLRTKKLSESSGVTDRNALLEAWKPFAMGEKRLWWEAVALPDDVDPLEEASFRSQIKELAEASLSQLKAALGEPEFAPLFSLEIYGSIIGMFELNNLDVVVASPVENYFLYIQDLEPALKEQTEQITRPLFEALGEKYASFCQGSGFFALHSCINHSCEPNAKAFKRDEDINGNAVIIATRKIMKGEQIFTSYIEEEDLSYTERQAMLSDYGFACECTKCFREKNQS
ncbi:histone-lysine N-methyltransferase ATXR2 [Selaginella moellendorffii]|uniref:histone-lysine N-methyltransferase ATXR2 n=1 Tax=Selaginella moellendorffii TaxID=88036 RepID=UPI000D1C6F9D|nr:histone-lysine N-methyltransferase ATXR2 [Selaginella moellendorffii]|eukprot:XP_024526796.1 histone-lysine N-methyltransferase ATXR2 [Selaginella moellendorffii]